MDAELVRGRASQDQYWEYLVSDCRRVLDILDKVAVDLRSTQNGNPQHDVDVSTAVVAIKTLQAEILLRERARLAELIDSLREGP